MTITIYETSERYTADTEQGLRDRAIVCHNAQRPAGRVLRATTIEGPVEAADMGFGVWGGRIAGTDGVFPPSDILTFARRGERGLSIVEG
jgi:hypothetical protein